MHLRSKVLVLMGMFSAHVGRGFVQLFVVFLYLIRGFRPTVRVS